jgi:small subunit ribosomal protein S27Ae
MGQKDRTAKKKGKRVRKGKKHSTQKAHAFYDIKSGAAARLKKHCPRCGPGTRLAAHKGRSYCGKCAYTEFERKAEAKPAPAAKAQAKK